MVDRRVALGDRGVVGMGEATTRQLAAAGFPVFGGSRTAAASRGTAAGVRRSFKLQASDFAPR